MTVEQNVINVLNEDIVHRINFQFASVRISGNDYEVIVRAIRHRHITCQHNTILASVGAGAYAHDLGNHCNVLNLPFANPQSVQEKAKRHVLTENLYRAPK